jgi:ribose transport system substrate-binding protein
MKKSLVEKLAVGLVLMGLLLAGCAAPAAEEPLFVGYSGPTQLDNFQIVLWEGMQERAEELGVEVVMLESDWDPVQQAADIEDLLAQGVDALIVNAADADGVIPSIEKANEQGVPVFTIDSAANGGEVLNHSGNDLYCIGFRSMEYLTEQLGGAGKVLHVNGVPGLMIVTWNEIPSRIRTSNWCSKLTASGIRPRRRRSPRTRSRRIRIWAAFTSSPRA